MKFTKENLRSQYWDLDKTQRECAKMFGLSQHTIARRMIEWKIPARDSSSARSGIHCAWTGKKHCKNWYRAMHRMITRRKIICEICGKEFERIPSEIREKNYCSKECRSKFMSKFMTGFKHTEETKERMRLSKQGKNNPMYGRKGKLSNNWNSVEVTCNYCKKKFMRTKEHSERGKNFCSLSCVHNWLATDENPYRTENSHSYGAGWKRIRNKILERDGQKCSFCGKTKSQQRLQVHHIIPYDVCRNHNIDNLITLCATCHGKQQQNDWHYRRLYGTIKNK